MKEKHRCLRKINSVKTLACVTPMDHEVVVEFCPVAINYGILKKKTHIFIVTAFTRNSESAIENHLNQLRFNNKVSIGNPLKTKYQLPKNKSDSCRRI